MSEEVEDLKEVIRSLQGQIDDLRAGHLQSVEVRKLRKKLEREEAETARLQELVSEYWPAHNVVQALRTLMERTPHGGTAAQ
jgi:chromosome segregation ATPase